VPASPEFLRVARMMTAGVASRLDFTYDEVEDLRIAIDELCFSLVGRHGRPGTIALHYTMLTDGVEITGTGHFDDHVDEEPTLSPLSAQILEALADSCQVGATLEGPTFRMVKRRRTS
jgi:serine/threonine-protein kinase RsbW